MFGSIAGESADEKNYSIANCYYLEGTYEGGINKKDTEQAKVQTRENMISENFVNTLNGENKDKPWKKGKEYPILFWQ